MFWLITPFFCWKTYYLDQARRYSTSLIWSLCPISSAFIHPSATFLSSLSLSTCLWAFVINAKRSKVEDVGFSRKFSSMRGELDVSLRPQNWPFSRELTPLNHYGGQYWKCGPSIKTERCKFQDYVYVSARDLSLLSLNADISSNKECDGAIAIRARDVTFITPVSESSSVSSSGCSPS